MDVNARELEVVDALRYLVAASDCHDIRRCLLGFGLDRPTNCLSRRLTSLELKGLVRRCGVKAGAAGKATTLWRLL